MEGNAKKLYDSCVALLCDQAPPDPKLLERATGGLMSVEHGDKDAAKLVIMVLQYLDGDSGAAKPRRKRRGRPKGSKNKPKKEKADGDGDGGDGGDGAEAKPRKRRGRPATKSTKAKPPKEEGGDQTTDSATAE